MIQISSVRHGFLSIPDLTISPGMVAITGPNGSGKTTLLEMIAGIVTPPGTISVNGVDPRKVTVGWVGEFPDCNMIFTRVFDEIASPLRFGQQPCEEIDASVHRIAGIIGLTDLLDHPVRRLSGGEKVLAALAAALISRPEVLILDETDSHLDATTLNTVDSIIRSAAVPYLLFATHRPDRVARADRVIVLQDGRVLREGTPDEIYRETLSRTRDHLTPLRLLRNPELWRAVNATDP